MNPTIRLPFVFWVFVLVLLFAAKFAVAEPYKQDPGPHAVETELIDLQDDARDRTVPIKVYRPKLAEEQPLPVVLLSHGLGGTRKGLSYLANHWASHGYTCIVMQHLGSDESVWKGVPAKDRLKAMRAATNEPIHAVNRAKDVTFVLDTIEAANGKTTGPLHGHYDLDKLAIAGHSYGAWTCFAAGGMLMPTGQSLADERIKCIIPLSGPAVRNEKHYDRVYSTMKVPALHMTGTLDFSAISDTTPDDRRIPYKHSPGPANNGSPKYLIFFDGADHMTFSGELTRSRRTKVSRKDNAAFHTLIQQSTTAFLDCYLLEDQDAEAWLNDGAFKQTVGDRGTIEMDIEK